MSGQDEPEQIDRALWFAFRRRGHNSKHNRDINLRVHRQAGLSIFNLTSIFID